jgi:hypothetical protein
VTPPVPPDPSTLVDALNAWANAWASLYCVEHTPASASDAQERFDLAEHTLLKFSEFGQRVLEEGGARG